MKGGFSMAQKVAKVGIKREAGYLYFVDKNGDVSCAKMARGGSKGGSPKKVAKVGIKKEKGYLYFVDKNGDISSAKMVRGGKAKKKSSAKKTSKRKTSKKKTAKKKKR
ncbi:MAG: hypothetical protein COW13_04950 [Candidatus Omnitrophica bacterium CG12_big_fil_rev_8_21_14_0_65_50_5]|nr:MAG: hypothetical protein COW13_04950 [Candidatus Omnitrophica bacterium CG12_big_fil_rev_8_21_14_0_65_50_5]